MSARRAAGHEAAIVSVRVLLALERRACSRIYARIDQLRVGNRGHSWRVGDQIRLPVVLRKTNGQHSENQEWTRGET